MEIDLKTTESCHKLAPWEIQVFEKKLELQDFEMTMTIYINLICHCVSSVKLGNQHCVICRSPDSVNTGRRRSYSILALHELN